MKRKIISILLTIAMAAALTACGQTQDSTEPQAAEDSQASGDDQSGADGQADGGNVLIAYFSWSGNTAQMASYIQEQTGGGLFEIQPVTPYPEDYEACGDIALEERDSNARPEIQNLPDSLEGYDTLFIGYPIWWHTAPMIIGTFLENYDLTGIDVYPFTQSASMDTEQFDNSMEFVRGSAGNGTVHDGLFADAEDTEAISAYLTENGFGQ